MILHDTNNKNFKQFDQDSIDDQKPNYQEILPLQYERFYLQYINYKNKSGKLFGFPDLFYYTCLIIT